MTKVNWKKQMLPQILRFCSGIRRRFCFLPIARRFAIPCDALKSPVEFSQLKFHGFQFHADHKCIYIFTRDVTPNILLIPAANLLKNYLTRWNFDLYPLVDALNQFLLNEFPNSMIRPSNNVE